MPHKLLVLVLVSLLGPQAIARDVLLPAIFDAYDMADGLSQSTVHCILQDSRGYLWIGTDDGLNRYDGTQFVQYHSDPADSTSLFNSGVWSLCEDSSGAIWVGTQKSGLSRFNRKTGTFQHLLSDSMQQLLNGDAIICILSDLAGNIWAGTTKSGLVRIEGQTGVARILNTRNSGLPTDRVRCLASDGLDHILIGTSNKGLIRMHVETSETVPLRHADAMAGFPFVNVQNLSRDSAGDLWLATLDAGVQHLRRDSIDPEVISSVAGLPGTAITRCRSVIVDRRNTLWAASASEGLIEYRIDSRSLLVHRREVSDPTAIPDDNLLCLALDRADDLWIGTWSAGLARLRLRTTPFHSLTVRASEPTADGTALAVLALAESSDEQVLVGTVGHGLRVLDVGSTDLTDDVDTTTLLAEATITSFLRISNNDVLVGTYNEGMFGYSPAQRRIAPWRVVGALDSLSSLSVLCLTRDSSDALWLGTVNHGAMRISRDLTAVSFYKTSADAPLRISDDIVYALHTDRSGRVWLGTLDGLDCVDPNGHVIRSYRYERTDVNTISNSEIRAVADDAHGNVWVGTSNGLNRIAPDLTTITRFTVGSGLVNGVVYGLLIDENDNAWISTNRGISVVRARSNQIENYFTWDGIPAGEFNQGAYAQLSNGDLLFGGSQAITRFNPDSVRARPVPMVITAVRDYQSNEFLARDPGATDALELPHRHQHLVIDYSAIEFYGGVQRGYAYRLLGVTDGWIRNVPTNSAVFTNLDPGAYHFEVKREGADDTESTILEIVILPPWWSRPEAVLLWSLLVGAALFATVLTVQRRAGRQAVARRERELQLSINRMHLLDLLSIVGHNQSSRNCFDGLLRSCNRFRDPEDEHAAERLRSFATEYLAHTSEKIDDLPARVPLAEIEPQFSAPLVANAGRMDQLIRTIANGPPADVLRRLAPQLAASIEAFYSSFHALINHLARFYHTDVCDAMQHVLRSKQRQLDADRVAVHMDCPDHYLCFIDRTQFTAVFDDLVANSLEAMRSSATPRLTVRVVTTAVAVEIYLSDTGCGLGLPRSEWDRIFQRRYSTKSPGQGGLGLYNAKRTLLRYQGDVCVHESAPGVGTSFRITLRQAKHNA